MTIGLAQLKQLAGETGFNCRGLYISSVSDGAIYCQAFVQFQICFIPPYHCLIIHTDFSPE